MTSGFSAADAAVATGTVAAFCTTLAFVPQLFKTRRDGGSELSSAMLFIYLVGLGLWLIYGIANHATPVIAANAASLLIVAAITARKTQTGGARARRAGRLRIAIDMDEVMADALGEHLRRYNAAFGTSVTTADLAGRHLEQWAPAIQREAIDGMLDASFFAELALLPDCHDVIRELSMHHDVYIVTAAMEVPVSFDAKFQWLRRHFPFIPTSQIVFCGDKGIIDADYLIDDRARHFAHFRGRGLLFSAPHNAAETRHQRVNSWREVREYFSRIGALRGAARRSSNGLSGEPAQAGV